MQEYRQVQLFNARPDRLKKRIVEGVVVDVWAHIDAADAPQSASPVKLFESSIRVEHRQSQQGKEAGRVRLVGGTRRIIPGPSELVVERRVAPIDHWGGQRQRLDPHALLVHVGDSLFQVDELGRQQRGGAPRTSHTCPCRHTAVETLGGYAGFGVEGLAVFIEEVEIGLWEVMRVNVDRLPSSTESPASDTLRRDFGGGGGLPTGRPKCRGGQSCLQHFPARHLVPGTATALHCHYLSSRRHGHVLGLGFSREAYI